MLLLTALSLFVAASEPLAAGTQLQYRGRFVAEKGEAAASEKQFELTYLVAGTTENPTSLLWWLEERGHGGWSWLDRLGRWEFHGSWRPAGGTGPALSYERETGVHVVPLQAPVLTFTEPFAVGLSWLEGTLEYHVVAEEKKLGHEVWRVEVRSPIGRRRTLWVDRASPVIVAAAEMVFIGQGEPHEARWELIERKAVDPPQAAATAAAVEELLRLRTRLGVEPRTREVRWTAERLALLKSDLPAAAAKAQGTPVERLAQAAARDAKNQKDRANALGALQGKRVGRAAPQPPLETVAGKPLDWAELKGRVVVLHFWDYRDTPLEEPYGQVAYLDFLARQHAKAGVRVFGVVADERVTQAETRRQGVQSAKKLHAFMNLSYPLLVDGGGALKEFGDPRATGAKLPLFVVIDREGKVVHYHSGFYEVNRDRGLEELNGVIQKSLP